MARCYRKMIHMSNVWLGAIRWQEYGPVLSCTMYMTRCHLMPSIWPLATRQVPPWHDSHVKCVAARCRHTRRHIRAPPPVILGMKWISRGAPSHQLDTKCPIISHILDTKYITHQIYLKQCISQNIFSKIFQTQNTFGISHTNKRFSPTPCF